MYGFHRLTAFCLVHSTGTAKRNKEARWGIRFDRDADKELFRVDCAVERANFEAAGIAFHGQRRIEKDAITQEVKEDYSTQLLTLFRENARLKNELEMPQSWRNKQLKLANTERVPSRAMTSLSRSSSVQTPRSTMAGPKSQINIPRTVLSSRQGRDFHSIAHPKPLGPPKQPSSHFYWRCSWRINDEICA